MINEEKLREKVIAALENIYDPEIPVDIYRLGLVYKIGFSYKDQKVCCEIEMTLTSPVCPLVQTLVEQVYNISNIVEEIDEMKVNIVFDPPWSPEKMSFEARLQLGLL